MSPIEMKAGMKVKVVGDVNLRYMYDLENLTTGKVYTVTTGYGEAVKDTMLTDYLGKYQLKCDVGEFEIINDIGEPCWATLVALEDEPLFELVH